MAKKEYYKENGSYCTKIYLGRDSNGKPKYKKLKAKTTAELRKKERKFREELEAGLDVLNCDDTLEKWAERYINRQLDKVENELLVETDETVSISEDGNIEELVETEVEDSINKAKKEKYEKRIKKQKSRNHK